MSDLDCRVKREGKAVSILPGDKDHNSMSIERQNTIVFGAKVVVLFPWTPIPGEEEAYQVPPSQHPPTMTNRCWFFLDLLPQETANSAPSARAGRARLFAARPAILSSHLLAPLAHRT
jgi:hypothetical protein